MGGEKAFGGMAISQITSSGRREVLNGNTKLSS